MKAIQAIAPGRVEIVEIPKPVITRPDQLIVKIGAAGICGSDLHIAHGTNPYATYPRVLGHEMSGTVEQIGDGVQKFSVGDRVVVEPISYCGECYACRKGRPNVCRSLQVRGVHVDGGFAEYVLTEEKTTHAMPEAVNFVQGAMVEPYTIGAQSVWRGGVLPGDVVLVQGAGPIGLIVMDVAKRAGATCIISEVSPARLEFARKIGADHIVNPMEENLQETVMRLTDGMGANVVFEATGVPDLLCQSVEMASSAGTVVAMAFGNKPIGIDFGQVNKKELTLVGTRLQSHKFPKMIAEFESYLPHVDMLVSHVLPMSEFQKGFDLFADKNSGACKVVLTAEF